jgi:hypothetical protein
LVGGWLDWLDWLDWLVVWLAVSVRARGFSEMLWVKRRQAVITQAQEPEPQHMGADVALHHKKWLNGWLGWLGWLGWMIGWLGHMRKAC